MVGIQEDWTEADIDELNDALIGSEGPPEPEPKPEPEPEPGDDDDEEERGPRRRITRISRPMMVAILIGLAAGVVAAVLLFAQTLPPPSTTASVLTRNCEPTSPTPASGIPVGSGPNHVVWSCTPAPATPAFTINNAGSVTPSFTLGNGYTSLWVYPIATPPITTDCSSATNDKEITTGVSVTFNSGDVGGWNYCADYTSAPSSFGSMTVSWSQP